MAELVDALGSGSSVLTDVEVQVLSRAEIKRCITMAYGLSQLRKAFSLVFWSAVYNKNTTEYLRGWSGVADLDPTAELIRDSCPGSVSSRAASEFVLPGSR